MVQHDCIIHILKDSASWSKSILEKSPRSSISLHIDLLLTQSLFDGLWDDASLGYVSVSSDNWVGWFAIVYFFVFAFDTR